MRTVIGRNCIFNVVSLTECVEPGCNLNPITNTSTNPFCSGCGGDHFIEVYSGVNILAHVSWKPNDVLQWYPGGQHFDGDVRLQVEYTQANLDVIDQTVFVEVDGKKVEIKKYTPRGFQELNRIILEGKQTE
jgi:hypothetical protein